jgi:hypothetical protein
MTRVLWIAMLRLLITASASPADYCDEYKFGSPE